MSIHLIIILQNYYLWVANLINKCKRGGGGYSFIVALFLLLLLFIPINRYGLKANNAILAEDSHLPM